uniref:Uncharacterized protein n=1 Tax=viral metagenome TaxID=1070528 RepID=A0A6C0I251_9ZZZZ
MAKLYTKCSMSRKEFILFTEAYRHKASESTSSTYTESTSSTSTESTSSTYTESTSSTSTEMPSNTQLSKCALFSKLAASTPREYWLRHITSYLGSNYIFTANIINTETAYYPQGLNRPLIERRIIIVFLYIDTSNKINVIKGDIELNAKKDNERNIIHHHNYFQHSLIDHKDANHLISLKKYNITQIDVELNSNMIDSIIKKYVEENDPLLIVDKCPPPRSFP